MTTRPCQRHGCRRIVKHRGCRYCSKSCGRRAYLASLPAETKTAMGKHARAAQRNEEWERFKARLKVLADTEEQRWLLAYRYGLTARNTRRYRAKGKAA